jgi:type VI secretion system secreted protein Hcp
MAMDMFLEIEGVEGETQDKAKKGAIDVLAWSWGASQSGTMHMGSGGGAGKVNVQDISVTKWIDKSSTDLLLHVCNGEHYPKATLTCRKAGGDALEYLTITLTDVMITSLSTGGSGGEDRLTENISLNFAEFKIKYAEQGATGGETGGGEIGWDIAGNSKL